MHRALSLLGVNMVAVNEAHKKLKAELYKKKIDELCRRDERKETSSFVEVINNISQERPAEAPLKSAFFYSRF